MRRNRSYKGSSIVETVIGLMVLIPIVLFLVDVAAMVVAQTENDKLAKACARAAAEFPTGAGQPAAQQVFNSQKVSNLLTPVTLTMDPSGAQAGMVTCQTDIKCNLPVPVPLMGTPYVTFSARATEPIVGELP